MLNSDKCRWPSELRWKSSHLLTYLPLIASFFPTCTPRHSPFFVFLYFFPPWAQCYLPFSNLKGDSPLKIRASNKANSPYLNDSSNFKLPPNSPKGKVSKKRNQKLRKTSIFPWNHCTNWDVCLYPPQIFTACSKTEWKKISNFVKQLKC